jgi:predicted membrane protein
MENRNKDYIGAIFLIFLGTMFLLNTTGVIPWSMWAEIIKFWPIFLIFAGLKLILPKSKIGDILLTILAVLIFTYIGVTIYSTRTESNLSNFFRFPIKLVENDMNEEKEIELDEYEGVELINYDFKFGVSEFNITDSSEKYLDFKATYSDSYGEPQVSSNLSENQLDVVIGEKSSSVNFLNLNFQSPKYDIGINNNMLSNLYITNGVGKGEINLSNTQIQNIEVSTGTGQVDLTLSKDSIPSEGMTISTGTGQVQLTIPSDVGYLLKYSVGIGGINIENEDFSGIGKQGTDIKSSNYDVAEKILILEVSTGVGNFNLNFNN